MSDLIKYSFSTYSQPYHYDWVSIDPSGDGIDAPAYLLTGVLSGGDYQRNKTMQYLTMHFKKTETYSDGGPPGGNVVYTFNLFDLMTGHYLNRTVTVPEGATRLSFDTSASGGDFAIWANQGSPILDNDAASSLSSYSDNDSPHPWTESNFIDNPTPGEWNITVYTYPFPISSDSVLTVGVYA